MIVLNTQSKDEVFGMWKDHKETRNVRSFVRRLRKWSQRAFLILKHLSGKEPNSAGVY